jgi:hypothetical protein
MAPHTRPNISILLTEPCSVRVSLCLCQNTCADEKRSRTKFGAHALRERQACERRIFTISECRSMCEHRILKLDMHSSIKNNI